MDKLHIALTLSQVQSDPTLGRYHTSHKRTSVTLLQSCGANYNTTNPNYLIFTTYFQPQNDLYMCMGVEKFGVYSITYVMTISYIHIF